MNDAPPELTEMVRSLATMPAPLRRRVLDRLGEADAARLAPHLDALEVRPLSPALRSLADACAGPDDMADAKPRARAAIVEAVAAAASRDRGEAGDATGQANSQPPSLWRRAADAMAGR